VATGNADNIVFSGAWLSLVTAASATAALLLSPSGVYPWGGTALAMAKNVVAKVGRRTTRIREESLGPMPFTGIDLGEAMVLTGSFRTFDDDVVNTIFASLGTGSYTGGKIIAYPAGNNYRTGGLISDLGVKLLLTPDDTNTGRFLYLYNAVPLTSEDADLVFQRNEEWVIPFKFIALPDASNRTYAYGLREDLSSILV
jgi:hypothetical protein